MKRLSGSHGDDRFGYCAPHLLKPPLTLPDDDLAGLNRRFARIEVCLTHFEVGRDRLGCLLRSLCVLEDLLGALPQSYAKASKSADEQAAKVIGALSKSILGTWICPTVPQLPSRSLSSIR